MHTTGRRSQSRGYGKSRRGSRSRSKSRSKSKPEKKTLKRASARAALSKGLLDRIIDCDHRFSWWMHEHGLQLLFYFLLRVLEFSGDGIFLIPAAAVTYLLPLGNLTPELRIFFFNLLGAFIVDLISVTLIKNYVRRHRPYYCVSHDVYWSFPSAHSTRALMVVTFFTMYMPIWKEQAANVWLPFLRSLFSNQVNVLDEGVPMLEDFLVSVVTWFVFSWAVASTSSRIILGHHFFFDVLIGCFVGTLESVLYNNFLVIPPEVSLAVHGYISSFFGAIEDTVWRLFNDVGFYTEGWTKSFIWMRFKISLSVTVATATIGVLLPNDWFKELLRDCWFIFERARMLEDNYLLTMGKPQFCILLYGWIYMSAIRHICPYHIMSRIGTGVFRRPLILSAPEALAIKLKLGDIFNRAATQRTAKLHQTC